MKQRFYLFRRRGTFYLQDSRTRKQQSLETKDRPTALRLLEIKRQTDTDNGFNQFLLKRASPPVTRCSLSAPGARSWSR